MKSRGSPSVSDDEPYEYWQASHSNLAPQTEHSLASTGISAPHAPHSAVSTFFERLLTPRRLLFSAAAAARVQLVSFFIIEGEIHRIIW